MKKIFVLAIFAIGFSTLYAQSNCGVTINPNGFNSSSWLFNRNVSIKRGDSIQIHAAQAFLQHHKTSTTAIGGFEPSSVYKVPVAIYIIGDGNGNYAATEEQIQAMFQDAQLYLKEGLSPANNEVNASSRETNIRLYIKSIHYRNEATLYDLHQQNEKGTRESFQAQSTNFNYGALNLYIVNSIASNSPDVPNPGGFATLPNYGSNDKLKSFRIWQQSLTGGVLIHEVGHALGLLHTHQGWSGYDDEDQDIFNNHNAASCYQEKVNNQQAAVNCQTGNGTSFLNCELFGDRICDTQADPGEGLLDRLEYDSGTYTGPLRDHDGARWTPPFENLMSYYQDDRFAVQFSAQQSSVMLNTIAFEPVSGFKLHYANEFLDVFEPDDARLNVNAQYLEGEQQHRGLHKIIHGNRDASNTYSYIDEDLIYLGFLIRPKKIDVITSEVLNGNGVHLLVEIVDETGTVLVSNEDPSGADKYPDIIDQIVPSGDYFVRITHASSASTADKEGEYYVSIDFCETHCCYDYYIDQIVEINSSTGAYNISVDDSENQTDVFIGKNLQLFNQFGLATDEVQGFPNGEEVDNNRDFDAYVCNSAQISVEQNGILKLGDEADVNLYFTENTQLSLNYDGRLVISRGSNLIIQDGAELVFNEGAQIQIEEGATLEIQGKLSIGNNAAFTFSGNGTLIFNQDKPWVPDGNGRYTHVYSDYISLGTSSSFVFNRLPNTGDYGKTLIEVKKPLHLREDELSNQLDAFELQNVSIALHPGALLFSYAPTHLNYVEAYNANPTNGLHEGLRLWYNSGQNLVQHSKFSGGRYGVLAHWIAGGSTLRFLDNIFTDNETGLELDAGPLYFTDNIVEHNNIGLKGTNLQGNLNLIRGCHFNNNKTHADLSGSNQTTNSISQSTFDNSTYFGVQLTDISSTIRCSEFSNNLNAIYIINAYVYMNDEAENKFIGNTVGIKFEGSLYDDPNSKGLYLENGNNEFLLLGNGTNQAHIAGIFYDQGTFNSSLPASVYTPLASGNNAMVANGNYFQLRQIVDPSTTLCCAYEMPVAMAVQTGSGPTANFEAVQISVSPNVPIQRSCDGGNGENPSNPYTSQLNALPTSANINGKNLQAEALAAVAMISFGETQSDDPVALELLQNLLTDTYTNMDANGEVILRQSRQYMLNALENCFFYGHFEHAGADEGVPVHTEIVETAAILDGRLLALANSGNSYNNEYFELSLGKALSYRNGGHYLETSTILESMLAWASDVNLVRSNYWLCTTESENQLLQGTIDPEEYIQLAAQCKADYAAGTYKQDESTFDYSKGYIVDAPTSVLEQIELYPVPVQNILMLAAESPLNKSAEYAIHDLKGVLLQSGDLSWENGHTQIDVSNLRSGVFVLSLIYEKANTHHKFVKQ